MRPQRRKRKCPQLPCHLVSSGHRRNHRRLDIPNLRYYGRRNIHRLDYSSGFGIGLRAIKFGRVLLCGQRTGHDSQPDIQQSPDSRSHQRLRNLGISATGGLLHHGWFPAHHQQHPKLHGGNIKYHDHNLDGHQSRLFAPVRYKHLHLCGPADRQPGPGFVQKMR